LNNITITGLTISQNGNGLYSLNDLHKASGLPAHKAPGEFIKNDRTKKFINVLVGRGFSLPLETAVGGRSGTFGVKQVLCAYGSWLSPEIDVEVHEAFIEKIEQKPLTQMEMIHGMSGALIALEAKLAQIPILQDEIKAAA